MNFVMSYSGGKDSVLSLYRMITEGHNPIALITTVNACQKRSWFHGIETELMYAVSNSLRIPLLVCECIPDDYTGAYEDSLRKAKQMGAEACVFGDIDIEGHRSWNEERCKTANLKCIMPLWQQNREELTREAVSVGFKAMIKIVQSDKLDTSFLGCTLTQSLIDKIKATGIDVCGENGEYHTFVYDGPIFSYSVLPKLGEIIDFSTHKVINILYETK